MGPGLEDEAKQTHQNLQLLLTRGQNQPGQPAEIQHDVGEIGQRAGQLQHGKNQMAAGD